jgi:hypothetical protein
MRRAGERVTHELTIVIYLAIAVGRGDTAARRARRASGWMRESILVSVWKREEIPPVSSKPLFL